jgi:hypothetical protein
MSKRTKNVSGKGLLGARSVSEGEQEFARPLLMPDEVLRLPYDQAIVTVAGAPPYRGKKLMYYLDPRFTPRVNGLHPPDSPREQRAELLRGRRPSEWQTLKVSAPPPEAPPPSPITPPAAPAIPPTVEVDTTAPADVDAAGWGHYFGAQADWVASTEPTAESAEAPSPVKRSGVLPL